MSRRHVAIAQGGDGRAAVTVEGRRPRGRGPGPVRRPRGVGGPNRWRPRGVMGYVSRPTEACDWTIFQLPSSLCATPVTRAGRRLPFGSTNSIRPAIQETDPSS